MPNNSRRVAAYKSYLGGESGGTFDSQGRPRPDRDRAQARHEAQQRRGGGGSFDQTKGGVINRTAGPAPITRDNYTVTSRPKPTARGGAATGGSTGGDGRPGSFGLHV